jgi:hypothetical protein
MYENNSWQDNLYQKTFDEEFIGLERRCASDLNSNLETLELMLNDFYRMEGADWLGRGEVQSIILSATIAAHESFIENLKAGAKCE